MAPRRTEAVHKDAGGIDAQAPDSVLRLLADAQVEAARAVHAAIPEIAQAAAKVAACLAAGGRLVYAAAGSSGLMALADALELPGTFGIPRERVFILLAGGTEALVNLAGGPEDDAGQAARDVAATGLEAGDCLIAVSASGSTPYAMGALEEAARRGAATIAFANNAGAPMFGLAEISVLLATPPEVVAGSTRMGAGTAQKIALNMMSTLAAVHLGHVHDGYMVNLHADNIKLHERAAGIVSAIAGCDTATAISLLEKSGGSVKVAVLLASGATSPAEANQLLEGAGQRLRPALSKLEGSRGSHQ
ncbi:N-acetylmuramic acid 6-phosphate etherase [Aminobacter sp. AP02]|uniref:N-acetylmuramic acid 6-phosphate etherase n=1 Tax=Aminobacter sp. AP02 TaxID=2135737 RepID=UPI000D6B5375|nr:N-acetylmuramic acid 6-phosphate etherase [Aminobacter sp. AP02]PWK70565.1 N-acetylmuramic acid 6-phosphate etherase [Aminobacter sp. AP02]